MRRLNKLAITPADKVRAILEHDAPEFDPAGQMDQLREALAYVEEQLNVMQTKAAKIETKSQALRDQHSKLAMRYDALSKELGEDKPLF
jgi:chromosome segregation ATPase